MKFETQHKKKIIDKYVYRYLTIEKLIDFFDTNSIYLSRLDTFEDNLENIEPYDINEIKLLILTKPTDAKPDSADLQSVPTKKIPNSKRVWDFHLL
ncbi:hypothetical protein [Flavobacterium sp.]|jgi:hypothetical protein|uniref:hypothetical protein n=1 Tax=Flavobacterium sp. TaxID=239 RepID=UPI003782E84F